MYMWTAALMWRASRGVSTSGLSLPVYSSCTAMCILELGPSTICVWKLAPPPVFSRTKTTKSNALVLKLSQLFFALSMYKGMFVRERMCISCCLYKVGCFCQHTSLNFAFCMNLNAYDEIARSLYFKNFLMHVKALYFFYDRLPSTINKNSLHC